MCTIRAHAESPTLAGRWTATPLRSDWNIGDWGKPCGPTPSDRAAAGGTVTITSAGSELHFNFTGRDYTTAECWEQFPGLARVSHASAPRSWQNACKTKPADPRQATLNTTISATDNAIHFDETGQYQFVIAGQNCTASVRRSRNLSLVQREGEPMPVPVPLPLPEAPPAVEAVASAAPSATAAAKVCAAPGPAEQLEVRPAQKLMRPGESFEFKVRVLDAVGCALALSPAWKVLSENAAVELTAPGRVHVPESAGEATILLQATLAGHAARVTLEIASLARYDALLAQRGLNAEGESNDAAVARIATTAIGGGSVVAADDAQRRRVLFVGVVGGSALLLGLLGFVLVQLSRRRPPEPETRVPKVRLAPATTPSTLTPLAKICPTCREEYPADAAFCPNDGNRLVPALGAGEPPGPSGGVCPICGQGFDPGVLTCPRHGEELLPAAMHGATRTTESPVTKKICPTCAKQYAGDSQFCGDCGALLVPVN